jgi:hyperosmotically inducible protein
VKAHRLFKHCAVIALAGLLAAPAIANQPEDAFITTKVKMALLTDELVDGLDIDVDTFDGQVTLHGQVDSAAEKSKAEELARKVKGVTSVRNILAIVPAKARDEVKVSDDALAKQVRTVLERDQALASSDIDVKSANNGVIVLAGEARTLSAHLRAIEDARAVPGVRSVASEVKSPDKLADAEIWEEAHNPGTAGDMKSAASDAWITTKAKVRLMAEPGLSPISTNVDTRQGIVTLFGTVGTEDAKARAGTEVRKVAGVKAVENALQVVPDVAAKRVEAEDDDVQAAVRQRLDANGALGDSDIDIAVENGVVRLTGTVATQSDRMTALTVARSTTGVGSVIDGLEVKPQG